MIVYNVYNQRPKPGSAIMTWYYGDSYEDVARKLADDISMQDGDSITAWIVNTETGEIKKLLIGCSQPKPVYRIVEEKE